PHLGQRAAAPFSIEADVLDGRMGCRQRRTDHGGRVSARVVGDDDCQLGGSSGVCGEQCFDGGGEAGLLVVHRNDEVDCGGCHGRGGFWLRLGLVPGDALMSAGLKTSWCVWAQYWSSMWSGWGWRVL